MSFLTSKTFFIATFVAIALPLVFSWFVGGWVAKYLSTTNFHFDTIPDLTGKIALVTGANTGIGKITVRELARKHAKVILSSRSYEKGLAAKTEICQYIGIHGNVDECNANVDVIDLDLSSLHSVQDFASKVTQKYSQLDMVVLNAGVMACPYSTTKEGYELQFGTNHLGHFFLTKLLLPLVEKVQGKIVVVSSTAHIHTYSQGIAFDQLDNEKNYDTVMAYGQSKLANILFANELAERVKHTGVRVNSLHPGTIMTDLARHIETSLHELGGGGIISQLLDLLMDVGFNAVAMNADDGALTQLFVATSPTIESVTGKYFIPIGHLGTASSHAQDVKLQKLLWERSEEFVNKFLNKSSQP